MYVSAITFKYFYFVVIGRSPEIGSEIRHLKLVKYVLQNNNHYFSSERNFVQIMKLSHALSFQNILTFLKISSFFKKVNEFTSNYFLFCVTSQFSLYVYEKRGTFSETYAKFLSKCKRFIPHKYFSSNGVNVLTFSLVTS